MCSDGHTKALTLTALTPERVAGAFRFQGDGDSADVTFDLKVEATLERGGTALPADGGAPGRAFLAHFAAMEKGDLAGLRATEPPESRAKRAATDPMVSKEMLQMMSAMAPRNVKIAGGSVDGDAAVVEFAGVVGGKAATGFVNCVQIAGAWYVTSVHTRK